MDRPIRHKREAQRLINRRQQGDLGEASAIEWLTRQGATVSAPLGHSPDYDLIGEIGGRLLRVQVKTSTQTDTTPEGHERWSVSVCTNGGNQSWSGMTKRLDPTKVDAVFVLVGDGRRWFIPAYAIEGHTCIALGGSKYSPFEVERADPIMHLVYEEPASHSRIDAGRGSADVGESGWPVKSVPLAEWVRIPPPPSPPAAEAELLKPGSTAQTRISSHHQITIPTGPFGAGEFAPGDRLLVRVTGPGEATIKRIERSARLALAEAPGAQ